MRLGHSAVAFTLTALILVSSLWTQAQTFSFNWALIILQYCVLAFYCYHILAALWSTF